MNSQHTGTSTAPDAPGAGRETEGSYLVGGGELITWKVRGAAGDAYSLFENVTQPGYAGPPPHRHLRQDESFYALAGDFTFTVDGRDIAVPAGATVHVPRGTLHTFRNTGATLGRLLVTVGPAGDFEAFVGAVGEPTQATEPPEGAGPPSPEVVARVVHGAQAHGIELAPPAAPGR